MKRELKDTDFFVLPIHIPPIARLIPMKRELKEWPAHSVLRTPLCDRKAHPDEKGTESP